MTNPATPTPADLPEALPAWARRLAANDTTGSMDVYLCLKSCADEIDRLAALSAAPTTEQSSEVAQAGAPADMEEEQCRCEPSEWVPPRGYDGDGSVAAMARRAAPPQAGAESYPPSDAIAMAEVWQVSAADCEVNPGGVSEDYNKGLADGMRQCAKDLLATAALRARGATPDWQAEFQKLQTPQGVHGAMLRGQIAKITPRECADAHGAEALEAFDSARGAVPSGWVQGLPITEEMHVAACKVLTRANGLDGTPQRMLDAMLAVAPAAPMSARGAVPSKPLGTIVLNVNGRPVSAFEHRGVAQYVDPEMYDATYPQNAPHRLAQLVEQAAAPQPPAALPGEQDAARSIELTDDVRFILGFICFQCMHIVQALRLGGREINTKAEDEQAAAIHFMLNHYLADRENWRENVNAELRDMAAKGRTEGGGNA